MSTRQRFRDRVADYFRARPGRWIPHRHLFAIGGECAWRTRVSDCHLELGMTIRNKVVQVRRRDASGAWVVVRKISFRKFVQDEPVVLSVEASGQTSFL